MDQWAGRAPSLARVSWDSILDERIAEWSDACLAWDFELRPEFSSELLDNFENGYFALHAEREAVVAGEVLRITLTIEETWSDLPHPKDSRLDRHGGSLRVLRWHAQVGPHTGAEGAERLDVILEPDDEHPLIHRHPYGEPSDIRQADEFRHADGFLHRLNQELNGALDDRP